ncbi:hypothetical protein [uncultured Methanobrevibacter sp.]|uniref:hypothetical protein n=1 Tax=uncultured Methanobrevibacter sp. TaxID=253161 RepID=UPI002621B446|nr:hypothetical protein [uncultured Methanobrevibacter sp.]
MKLNLKRASIIILLILIVLTTVSAVSASMEIKGASFSTGSELEDKTYATIYVTSKYAGDAAIVQIYYSRDGSLLNNGNMVPITVDSQGYIDVSSADAYSLFPDKAEVNLYDSNSKLLDTETFYLSPSTGLQTFGSGDFGSSSTSSSYSDAYSSYSSSSYSSGSDSYGSYIGNSNSHKFHSSGCGDVNKMKDSNKVYFSSRDEAINSGYSPCGHCHP